MQAITFGDNQPGLEIGDKVLPAVIVVQEWWGITDSIREIAEKVHRLGGYRVLIPDLYKGKIGVDKEEAKHLMTELGWEAGTEAIKQAATYLKESGSTRVGIVGFCTGGALAFCAAEVGGVDCAVPFYGIPPPSACNSANIKIPIQAHFGKLDSLMGFSDPNTAQILEATLKAANVPCEFFYYENSGHAFMNPGEDGMKKREMIGAPQPPMEDLEEAWKRMMHFFMENLKTHV